MTPQTHVISQQFPCSEPISAGLRLGSGSIAVTAEDRPDVVVNIDPYDHHEASRQAAEESEVSYHGGALRIEVPHGVGKLLRRGGAVRVELRVPLDSRIEAQVGSADIRTEGRLAEAVLRSGSGDFYVAHTTGLLRADSGSGDVRADEVGELRADTASGDVSVTFVTGDAQVKTASGDIEIEDVRGAVKTSSASGTTTIGAARGSKVNVRTASGDAEIGVPAGTRVWLDLNTASGNTVSDLIMTDVPDQGAQLSVEVRTASGDIRLRRVAPTAQAQPAQAPGPVQQAEPAHAATE